MRGLLVALVLCVAVHMVSASREKPGTCPNRYKRDQCQCAPHGSDDCGDECSEDSECGGLRKCCTNMCRRECTPVTYRPPHRCPPGRTWDLCPPPTDPTCPTEPVPPRPEPVPLPNPPCEPRCVCRPGYVAVGDGRCVKREHVPCPPVPPPSRPTCAGMHEIYHDCYQGCQASCHNPSGSGCVVSHCVRGCFCAPGFVRSIHGRCVRPDICPPPNVIKRPPTPTPPRCPDNQEFSVCRRECEATCVNPHPRGCFRSCQAGCFCTSPFVRDHYGNCVHPDQCVKATTVAPECGPNEEYRFCSTKCQGTCENPNGDNCYARCETGCFCADGYVRTTSGECVQREACPAPFIAPPPTPGRPVCENELEEYIDCHRGCQRTCENPTGQGCSTDQCHSGCYCQAGLVRNHLGQCVPQHACASLGCGYHEHFEDCGSNCPPTCGNQTGGHGRGGECDTQCHSGCYCDDGYIRNPSTGGCVSTDYCRYRHNRFQHQCGSNEDPVPCGACERECTNGFSAQSCPTVCRRRCCRRRFR